MPRVAEQPWEGGALSLKPIHQWFRPFTDRGCNLKCPPLLSGFYVPARLCHLRRSPPTTLKGGWAAGHFSLAGGKCVQARTCSAPATSRHQQAGFARSVQARPGRPVRDWEFFLPAVPARLAVLVQPFLSSAPQPTPARVRVARWWPTLIARQGMRSKVHADERVRRSQLRGVAIVVVSLRNTLAFLL